MQRTPHASRPIVPAPWLPAMRQRLPFFRLLTLVVAAGTVYAVAFTFAFDLFDPVRTALTLPAMALPLLWAYGYRRGALSLGWLVVESAAFLLFMAAVRDDYGSFGAMFFTLQHRALFGNRREATIMAVSFGLTLVGGYALIPQGVSPLGAVTWIELAVGGSSAYMMHTLAEVLQRDRERKLALIESEQRFRSVIENLREALVITDIDDVIILANARIREVLGYSPEELVGRPVTMLVPEGRTREGFRERLTRRKQGESELYETDLRHRDGRVIRTEISGAPYRDATGAIIGTLGAITDISARRHLQDRLRHATRLEAIGQLAGRVAHDFNNLLTVVKVHTELLLPETEPGTPQRDSVVEIASSADRGAALTKQLLAFSRRQMLKPRPVRLADVLGRAESILRDLLDDRVSLTVSHDGDEAVVQADPVEVEGILIALVRHANDKLPGGGRIEVRCERVTVQEQPPARGQDMPPGDYVALRVTDDGPPLPPEILAHLFDPFAGSAEPGLGGLGLAGAYGSARQSGAYVSAETAEGQGTTLGIWFPIRAERTNAGPVASLALAS